MKVLALETSTTLGGVALIIDGNVVAEESSLRQRSHSENMNPFVERCLQRGQLKLQDIDIFAVGKGPGSFTGIRVAANAGKTFSYICEKPLVSIDTLTLLAQQARDAKKPVLSIINAYKNMVYLGLFDVAGPEPSYIIGPMAIPVRELKNYIKVDCVVVGDGWEAYQEYFPTELKAHLIRDLRFSDEPLASTLGLMAESHAQKGLTLDWKSFTPLYIRASEAEETKKGILISPLT